MAPSTYDMHIAVLGAGMGGLTAALALAKRGFKHIDVYETASDLGFVGAGIQLATNMARVLDRLGCWEEIEREAVELKETSIRQGSTDAELAQVDLSHTRSMYEYPHMVGHRSSLAGALYKGCTQQSGIRFHFATTCSDIAFTAPPSFLATPRKGGDPYRVTADVVVAADGIKSLVRERMLAVLGVNDQVVDTGQAAYRIMLRRKVVAHDPELLALMDGNAATRWIGAKRHIIAYPVSSKQIYNISTSQPDVNFAAAPSATYTTQGSKTAMLEVFGDFCPRTKRMLQLVPEGDVCEWKLRVHAPLPTWVHGSVALLGDACHPTLPHLGQGAAQAIEDAAVVAVALDRCPDSSPSSIHQSLQVYEKVRKQRAETLVGLAAESGRTLHLGEGKAKEERDQQFAKGGKIPDKWADPEVQREVYGHDCVKVAEEQFAELWREVSDGR